MQVDTTAAALEGRTSFWTEGATLWLPPKGSTTAGEIDAVFNFILYASIILTALVSVAMVYFVWKYRRRSHADRPRDVQESKWLEISWIVVPTILVMIVFFWGFRAYVSTTIAPSTAYQIEVSAQQWSWAFTYPNGTQSFGEVIVPEDQPVQFIMSSQDVLHSFYVPAFRIKQDVLPNRFTSVWFEAPEQGVYEAVCTEYCGKDHSNMGVKIRVVGQDQFAEFLGGDGPFAPPKDLPPVEMGQKIYESRACASCHSLDGAPGVGPSWMGIWDAARPGSDEGKVDDAYIIQSILNPNAYMTPGFAGGMPSYEGQISEQEALAVAAYIRQINGAALPEDSVAPTGAEAAPQ